MPFDHKHYVPILKGKRAEFPSLGSLKSTDGITPLMEAIPSKLPTLIPQGMEAQWPKDQPYFIDFLFFDDVDEDIAPESHPLTLCFADVAKRKQMEFQLQDWLVRPAIRRQCSPLSLLTGPDCSFALRRMILKTWTSWKLRLMLFRASSL